MMGVGAFAMPFRRLRREALHLERLGALQPSLRHPDPRRLARGVAGELGHLFAVGGMAQEFVGRIHRLTPPETTEWARPEAPTIGSLAR